MEHYLYTLHGKAYLFLMSQPFFQIKKHPIKTVISPPRFPVH